jgi:hypothetical protein
VRLPGDLLERGTTDEIVVGVDEKSVADIPRCQLVVFGTVRVEAAAK